MVALSGINLTSSIYTSNESRLVVTSVVGDVSILSTHNSTGSGWTLGVLGAAERLLTGLVADE